MRDTRSYACLVTKISSRIWPFWHVGRGRGGKRASRLICRFNSQVTTEKQQEQGSGAGGGLGQMRLG